MLHIIYGKSGSGKEKLICDMLRGDAQRGVRAYLIVPEQQAVTAERMVAECLDSAGAVRTDSIEVLNFSRLANRIFREYGGLYSNYISPAGKSLVMWRALCSLSGQLTDYTSGVTLRDRKFIEMLLDTVRDLITYGVTPSALLSACDMLGDGALLHRTSDIALIYSAYEKLLHIDYSDPYDDLDRVCGILDEHDFFGGANVYIDSFTTFTPQEYAVIRRILAGCDQLYAALCTLPGERSIAFSGIRRTDRALRRIASDAGAGCGEDIVLRDLKNFRSADVAALSQNIWGAAQTAISDKLCPSIRIFECSDVYGETEAIARDIHTKIRGGARYRDFVIIARDIESYRSVIDVTLEKYNMPYFFSTRTILTEKPYIRMLLSALTVLIYGWRAGDVISYIKTGLAGIDYDECNVLENYVMTWNISGRMWYDGLEWNYCPRGYSEIFTEADALALSHIAELRDRISAPLLKLSDALKKDDTVRGACAALYNFLCDAGIREKLESDAADDTVVGGESVLLWNLIMESLDTLVKIAGGDRVNIRQLSELITMLLSETDMGHLPASLDEITIGGAAMLRTSGARHVYVMGVNDGVFPAAASQNAVFGDRDREILSGLGIELPPGSDRAASDELLFFYMSVSCASDSVSLSYVTGDLTGGARRPSSAIERVKTLFPAVETLSFRGTCGIGDICIRENLYEYLGNIQNSRRDSLADAIVGIAESTEDGRARLAALRSPVSLSDETLTEATARDIFGDDTALTQSRLDAYALCPFSFACKYVLKLSEQKRAAFRASDIGTLVHRVLEVFMRRADDENLISAGLSDEEISAMLDDIIGSYADKILRGTDNGRIRGLLGRLKRTSALLIRNLLDEFSQSSFKPSFFELEIKDGGTVRPLRVQLADKTSVYVYGVIDRVDTYVSGGDVYVRVVDYKTGAKDFSLSDIELGINLQMLLYLFSIWKNPSDELRRRVGISADGRVLPAGMLYFAARAPEITLNGDAAPDDIKTRALDTIGRRGLLISDKEVLSAMEADLGGHFIPVKVKRDGDFTAASPVRSIDEFEALMGEVEKSVRALAGEMKRGKMDVRPLKSKRHDACRYCPMRPVCRREDMTVSDGASEAATDENSKEDV